jgi:hypothetical protein
MLCRPGYELVGQQIEMEPRISWLVGQENNEMPSKVLGNLKERWGST